MNRVTPVFAAFLLLRLLSPVPAAAVDLATLLGNAGFEDDLDHSHWSATVKNANYRLDAPVVNPTILPFGETEALEAPAGAHFVGVVNPHDGDINGRLVHDVVTGSHPAGAVFTVTVFGSRGRLPAAGTGAFGTAASELTLQLFGWPAGSAPVVNPATDNWSRKPRFVIKRTFTAWPPNGEWGSQTFSFVIPSAVEYLSLAITGKNHKAASYVAFDVLVP